MPKLIIMNDQTGATGREIIDFESGLSATDILMKKFPDGINPETTRIYVRSQEIEFGDIPDIRLIEPLSNNDTIVLINEAKGLDPLTIGLIIIAAAAVSIALTPKIPGNVGQQKDSPNNNLQAQTNIARPYQAYPLVFGSPIVYPDLTGEPVTEYISNQKVVTQLMNIGVGLFDIDTIRAGDTLLSNFQGSSSTIFEPVNKLVTVPNVITSFAVNEIDGQDLRGVNDGVDGTVYSLVENGTNQTTFVGSTFTFEVTKDTASDDLKTDFDASLLDFIIALDYRADVLGVGGIQDQSGSGTINSITLDGGGLFYVIVVRKFNGEKAVDDIYEGPFTVTEKLGVQIGPISMTSFSEEIWVNIRFNRGLKTTVDIRIDMVQLDGPNGDPIIGPQQSFLFSITDDTLEQVFFTFKGTLLSPGFYQFTMGRTDQSPQNSNRPDNTTIEAVFSITQETNVELDNNTLLEVVMPATVNATSLRENQINLSLTSKLITYDGTNVVTTVAASRKMADALLHLYVDFFGLDSNTLALDELYEIQNRLDAIDPRLATFDFTFDDLDVSLDERMDAILNVARCYKWLDGDVYRFARDDIRLNEATLITRRDIVSEDQRDYSLSYNPQLLEAFDSVKVEFVNQSSNKKDYIFRKVDPASADPNNPDIIDGVGRNPKTMEIAGCSEQFNAINRAELEIRKLIYQRYILTETGLPAMMLLSRGDMVLYAEQYTSDLFDGEILNVTGNIATTSESIDFTVGALVLHYMLDDGTKVGPFSITEVVDEPFKFSSTDLAQAFVRDSSLGFTIQTGSRYIIGQTVDLETSRWTMVDKEARGDNVNLTLVTYDDRTYDFD